MKDDETDGTCRRHAHKIWAGKPEGKSLIGKKFSIDGS
jgi:hypothetical protein